MHEQMQVGREKEACLAQLLQLMGKMHVAGPCLCRLSLQAEHTFQC